MISFAFCSHGFRDQEADRRPYYSVGPAFLKFVRYVEEQWIYFLERGFGGKNKFLFLLKNTKDNSKNLPQ